MVGGRGDGGAGGGDPAWAPFRDGVGGAGEGGCEAWAQGVEGFEEGGVGEFLGEGGVEEEEREEEDPVEGAGAGVHGFFWTGQLLWRLVWDISIVECSQSCWKELLRNEMCVLARPKRILNIEVGV